MAKMCTVSRLERQFATLYLYPPPLKVCPPPSDVRADGKHGPWKEGGSVGLRKQAEVLPSGSAT